MSLSVDILIEARRGFASELLACIELATTAKRVAYNVIRSQCASCDKSQLYDVVLDASLIVCNCF